MSGPEPAIEIRWRSSREIVVWKPPGRSSELPGAAMAKSVQGELSRTLPAGELRLAHRLDRVACGLLLLSLDPLAAAHHAAAFRERRVRKVYLARVEGDPQQLLGPQRAYLRRVGSIAKVVRSGGRPAAMELLAAAPSPGGEGSHHLLIELGTGRFHQIRAMLAHQGHPLAGDVAYGGAPGSMWLESALLGFTAADGERVVLGGGDEPRREAVDSRIRDALEQIAAAAWEA